MSALMNFIGTGWASVSVIIPAGWASSCGPNGTKRAPQYLLVERKRAVREGKPTFQHAAFGVEDIDEVMIGVGRMGERGWFKDLRKAGGGLGRHRISSAIYCYVPNPNGGEAEYTCDTDYLDDNWIPRVWQWAVRSRHVDPRSACGLWIDG